MLQLRSVGRGLKANRKKRKTVAIPAFNVTIEKWCNLCEKVKKHDQFHKAGYTKDGLNSNCKECKQNQKQEYLKKKREDKKIEAHISV